MVMTITLKNSRDQRTFDLGLKNIRVETNRRADGHDRSHYLPRITFDAVGDVYSLTAIL